MTQLKSMGVTIGKNKIDKIIKEHNNFEMPLRDRMDKILSGNDPLFFTLLKAKGILKHP